MELYPNWEVNKENAMGTSNDTELDIFFWTDSQGRKRVSYGKASNLSPYDVSYGIRDSRENSVRDNLNHRRDNLSTERRKLHSTIIKEVFKGHKPYTSGQTKVAMFTGGGPATGKSTFTKNVEEYYQNDDNPVILDADALKERLLYADTGKTQLDDETSTYYHSESVILQKRLYEIAVQNDYPVLLDGTAVRYDKFMEKVQQAVDGGYTTKMRFMTADPNSLLDGSLDRYDKTGRIVPLNRILEASEQAQTVIPQLFNAIDDFRVYDRTGSKITLIAKGGKGKKIVKADDKLWDNMQEPNRYHLDSGAIAMYNNKAAAIKKKRKGS